VGLGWGWAQDGARALSSHELDLDVAVVHAHKLAHCADDVSIELPARQVVRVDARGLGHLEKK